MRSPPLRERALSAGDVNRYGSEEPRKKRKAEDTCLGGSEMESGKRRENPATTVVKNWMAVVVKYSQALEKLVEENSNTKKEIKEVVSKLKRSMDAIKKPQIQEWLEEKRWEVAPKQTSQACVQTDYTGKMEAHWEARLQKAEEELTFLKEANEGLQEENGHLKERNKALAVENARLRARPESRIKNEEMVTPEEIVGCSTRENFMQIANKKWTGEIYKAVFPVIGSPMGANVDADLLYLEEEGPEAQRNSGLRRALEERYPEIKETCETLAATVTTTYRDAQGDKKTNVRWILKTTADEDFFGAMTKIKQIMIERDRKKLAIYPPGTDPTGELTRKMLECVFRETRIKCILYRRQRVRETRMGGENGKGAPESRQTTANRVRRPDVLVVSQDGRSYSDILREVKSRVRPNTSAAKAIRNIRESRDKGKMVIVLNKGETVAREELVKEIEELNAVRVRANVDQGLENIIISGMDGITTSEEVVEAICQETCLDSGAVTVGVLRGQYGGGQSASIRLPREGAETLKTKERIRIGLNWCVIKERVEVIRCFRCWQYGHISRDCKADTDQSKHCWKCGGEGHKGTECTMQVRCLTCKTPGHTAGSGACPEFRKAVARERKARKKKRGY